MQTRYEQLSSQAGDAAVLERPHSAPPPAPVSSRRAMIAGQATTNGTAQSDRGLIEALTQSRVYQDYERAFTEATGLPVALRPVESWQMPLHGKRHEAPYCALMSENSRACGSCLQMQEKLSQAASHEAQTMLCPLGFCETAVPVRLGGRLIGFLMTGQVFTRKPSAAQYARAASKASELGVQGDPDRMKKAYFATRVLPARQQASVAALLTIFAEHLSMLSNQVVVRRDNAEPPAIARAKAYIQEHQAEDLSLGEVAKAVSMSSYYFCKMFRKVAGLNFTDYLSRVRIEKSKNLLLNPNLRVSEIAYEVGFQSLTHFNRVFKRVLGQSPSEYRAHLMISA